MQDHWSPTLFILEGDLEHHQLFNSPLKAPWLPQEYKTDVPMWNLTPLFPGVPWSNLGQPPSLLGGASRLVLEAQDGSTVFMDFAGGLYKLNLTTGATVRAWLQFKCCSG